eukprot:750249-Hanusia_phi.AAC.5
MPGPQGYNAIPDGQGESAPPGPQGPPGGGEMQQMHQRVRRMSGKSRRFRSRRRGRSRRRDRSRRDRSRRDRSRSGGLEGCDLLKVQELRTRERAEALKTRINHASIVRKRLKTFMARRRSRGEAGGQV